MGGSAVWWKGSQFDARTRDMLVEAERLCALDLQPSQGSWSSASASAGTHSGCGAYDGCIGYSTAQQDKAVDALRRVGFAAWRRTSAQGFTPHVHAIAIQPGGKHDRGCLHHTAHDQVVDYYEGRNGLASNAPDDGPRAHVGITWEQYQQQQPPPRRAQKMITIRAASSGTINILGGGLGLAGIANQTDLKELQRAIGDPNHVATVSDNTFNAIKNAIR